MTPIRYTILGLCCALLLWGCQSNDDTPPAPLEEAAALVLSYPTALYPQPNAQRPTETLGAGSTVYYAGKVSDHITTLTLQDSTYQEPWLWVKTAAGKSGWVYAGFVAESAATAAIQLPRLKQERRLAHYFGEQHLADIAAYTATYDSCHTAEDWLQLLQQGQRLRDTLNLRLNQYQLAAASSLQTLLWMQQPLPALVPTRIPQSDNLHLFFDFKALARLAQHTTGAADDSLAQAYLRMYSTDSIEYYYPSWTLVDGDISKSYSLLGEGLHHSLLATLSHAQQLGGATYRPLVQQLKRQVLDDIVASSQYWYDGTTIVLEVERIQGDKSLTVLNPDDRVALAARLKMLVAPEKHNITLNWRERL